MTRPPEWEGQSSLMEEKDLVMVWKQEFRLLICFFVYSSSPSSLPFGNHQRIVYI